MEHFHVIRILVGLLVITVFFAVLFFNRTPKRRTPVRGVVSPASGTVIEIKKLDSPDVAFHKKGVPNRVSFPELEGPVHVIIIEMAIRDVHVQRAPVTGTIIRMDHYRGHHYDALGTQERILAEENEKVVTVFENSRLRIGVVQVAGVAARRIRNKIRVGTHVSRGTIYGRILLGSQVVVVAPQSLAIEVAVGQKVVDGETILARE